MPRKMLFLFLAFTALSCGKNNYEVKIDWITLYDTAGDDFKKTRVTLDFTNGGGDKTFHLTPYKTTKIRLAKDMRLFGTGGAFLYAMYIYPDKYVNGINGDARDRFKNGAMEIYLYKFV